MIQYFEETSAQVNKLIKSCFYNLNFVISNSLVDNLIINSVKFFTTHNCAIKI